MAEPKMHTVKECQEILGLGSMTLKVNAGEAGVEFKSMKNPDTGRFCQGLDDNDIEAIRQIRSTPGRDVRKP